MKVFVFYFLYLFKKKKKQIEHKFKKAQEIFSKRLLLGFGGIQNNSEPNFHSFFLTGRIEILERTQLFY